MDELLESVKLEIEAMDPAEIEAWLKIFKGENPNNIAVTTL